MKIDGKALALKHEQKLRKELLKLKDTRSPEVISFCNKEDPPSLKYTKMKQQKALDLGINFQAHFFSTKTSIANLRQMIEKYNSDPGIDGILVQLPLPKRMNPFKKNLLNLINPKKDVDGLTEKGRRLFLPATVKGVLSIVEYLKIKMPNKAFVVAGSEGEVGKPMVDALKEKGAKVFKVDKNKGSLDDLKKAGIIISTTGEQSLIKEEMVNKGAILIDVGLGDFDPSCFAKASFYTPKFGGVGPMTVISLMENVVASFTRRGAKLDHPVGG